VNLKDGRAGFRNLGRVGQWGSVTAIALASAAATFLLFLNPVSEPDAPIGTVVDGSSAEVMPRHHHRWNAIAGGDNVHLGDTIRTGTAGNLNLILNDGKKLSLESSTTVEIKSISGKTNELKSELIQIAILEGNAQTQGLALRHESSPLKTFDNLPPVQNAGVLAMPSLVPLPESGPPR
jgi:hypothetical protein